jgi:hypothetical protein
MYSTVRKYKYMKRIHTHTLSVQYCNREIELCDTLYSSTVLLVLCLE